MLKRIHAEHAGWFGAGLSAAALGVAGLQLFVGAPVLATPPPPPALGLFSSPTPYPTRTQFPTRTPLPTRTAYPTRTPRPLPSSTPVVVAPDVLATLTLADPDRVVAAVATFAARVATPLAQRH